MRLSQVMLSFLDNKSRKDLKFFSITTIAITAIQVTKITLALSAKKIGTWSLRGSEARA